MTISSISIANSALVTLGAQTITSFNDTSLEAKSVNAKWEIVRRDLLRQHPWNFAVRRRVIAATTAGPDYEYDYQFTIPSESLRVLAVYTNYAYRLEGRNILTNDVNDPVAPRVEIKYIADVTDPAEWDAMFTNVMVYRLALELAYTLPGKNTMIEQMSGLYGVYLEMAKGVDASEDVEDELGNSVTPLIGVRSFY